MGSVRYTDSSQLNTYTNIVCTLGTNIIVLGELPVWSVDWNYSHNLKKIRDELIIILFMCWLLPHLFQLS